MSPSSVTASLLAVVLAIAPMVSGHCHEVADPPSALSMYPNQFPDFSREKHFHCSDICDTISLTLS